MKVLEICPSLSRSSGENLRWFLPSGNTSLIKVVLGRQYCSGEVMSYSQCFSVEAKDVVRKLLVVDPSKRMSIDEALQHPWLQVLNPRSTSLILLHLPALP